MSVLQPPTAVSLQPPTMPVHRFTVDEYHRMIQVGILAEDDPVELLEGLVVPKMPRNPPHDIALELADDAIRPALPPGWRVRIQSAVTTADSEPEPDLAVVRGSPRDREGRHPQPPDIGMLLEVADSSLLHDRQEKGRVYARASIVCYWIINLVDRQVEVYTDPSGPGPNPTYRQRQDYRDGDAVPLVLDGAEVGRIPVRDLLPSP